MKGRLRSGTGKKAVTIKHIAKVANTTPATVSMALRNHPRIGKETCIRIQSIADKMGYQPNLLARALVSKRSYSLGVVVPKVTDAFYAELLQAIEDKALEFNYHTLHFSTKNDLEKEKAGIDLLRSKAVDGLIIASAETEDPNISSIVEDGLPLVLVNRRMIGDLVEDRVDYVVIDNFRGAYMAMKHLYGLGHRRIGVITGMLNTSTGKERTEGARKFLMDMGMEINPNLFINGGWDQEAAYNAGINLLNLSNRPTAIFVESDEMALAVRDAILEIGLSIPTDMSLIGFDDIISARYNGIDMSTVGYDIYKMGEIAVTILTDKIDKRDLQNIKKIQLEPELIVRKTCGYQDTLPGSRN